MSALLLLALAGFLAGTMNAVVGGGTFVTIPALVWAGVPSVLANSSSTVALFPGTLASSWAYRDDFASFGKVSIRGLLAVSLLGGFVGALLLLWTPTRTFDQLIPWLLLLATLAFAFGRKVGAALRRVICIGPTTLLVAQFVLAIYGGYFGGGIGIMMMAVWSLLEAVDVKAMSPARVLLVSAMNAIAVVCFIAAGAVRWPETLAILVFGVIGGYAGARVARGIKPEHLRAVILVVSTVMTIVFFRRAY
jgi:uncharacterized membrane protein YfcA